MQSQGMTQYANTAPGALVNLLQSENPGKGIAKRSGFYLDIGKTYMKLFMRNCKN
jgi:hypothetical protein